MAPDADPPLAALVLAAGAGTRLRPLTVLRPKPLCPVGDRTLLDHALDRVAGLGRPVPVAVNAHHGAAAVAAHVEGRDLHLSHERDEALGTAGAVGHLRPWLDGRGVLVVNGDTFATVPLAPLVRGWDGERPRVLVPGPPRFGPRSPLLGTLLPWTVVRGLPATPAGLWEVCLRGALGDGSLEVVGAEGVAVDCGTPADYLRANLVWLALRGAHGHAGAGARTPGTAVRSVVGAGATVEGRVEESVVWPGAEVAAGERLVRAVRAVGPGGQRTVLIR